jgi:hypothetical protein
MTEQTVDPWDDTVLFDEVTIYAKIYFYEVT